MVMNTKLKKLAATLTMVVIFLNFTLISIQSSRVALAKRLTYSDKSFTAEKA
jgi:hypothetical protein